jgi:hypothetical protein
MWAELWGERIPPPPPTPPSPTPPYRKYTPTRLHGVTSTTVICQVCAVMTSNIIKFYQILSRLFEGVS